MTEYERLELKAAELAETLEPDEDDPAWSSSFLDPLRRVLRESEERLQEEGWLEGNRGAETMKVSDWRDRYRNAGDQHLFLFLVRDCIMAHLHFYARFNGKNSVEDLIEAVEDGAGQSSQQNCVKTLQWLEREGAPKTLEYRQTSMSDIF